MHQEITPILPLKAPHTCFECSYECDCPAETKDVCGMCSPCHAAKGHISTWWIDRILSQFWRGIIQVPKFDDIAD